MTWTHHCVQTDPGSLFRPTTWILLQEAPRNKSEVCLKCVSCCAESPPSVWWRCFWCSEGGGKSCLVPEENDFLQENVPSFMFTPTSGVMVVFNSAYITSSTFLNLLNPLQHSPPSLPLFLRLLHWLHLLQFHEPFLTSFTSFNFFS